eukprot:187480_1
MLNGIRCIAVCICILLKKPNFACNATIFEPKKQPAASHVVQLSPELLLDNIEYWTHDYAVLFYAKWCPHCKAFASSWDAVAKAMVKDNSVIVGKFNCEKSIEYMDFCARVGVTHYPTLMVFGFDTYPDRDVISGLFLSKSTGEDKAVKYQADIYLSAVYDWVRSMVAISRFQRIEHRIKSSLGLISPLNPMPVISKLREEIKTLKKQNEYLGGKHVKQVNGGSPELPESKIGAETTTDAFAELSSVQWDLEYLPVIACVADKASEYCRAAEVAKLKEPYCETLQFCINETFIPKTCRPATCPFESEGCNHVAKCITEEEIERYMDLSDKILNGN